MGSTRARLPCNRRSMPLPWHTGSVVAWRVGQRWVPGQWRQRGLHALRGESTDEENATLYKRGVNEGSGGELLGASELLELLNVFGEDGVRSYLVCTSVSAPVHRRKWLRIRMAVRFQ